MQPPQPLSKGTVAMNPPRNARVRIRTIPVEEISDQFEPEEEGYYRRVHPRRTPLSEELEEIQWPHRLNPAVLPQFDGESDPEEFLLKYEATIEAAGGGTTCKAKALVLALRGLAQRWYANIPPGSILSWNQLRSQLRSSFRAVRPDEVTSCDFHNLKQGSMTLQEYLQSLIKLRARGPDVTDQSIIDSVVNGISLGPCGEYLTRRKPKTVTKLFEIMQEYCISDRAKRQKLEEMNE